MVDQEWKALACICPENFCGGSSSLFSSASLAIILAEVAVHYFFEDSASSAYDLKEQTILLLPITSGCTKLRRFVNCRALEETP